MEPIKITFKEDFRCFKKDEQYVLDFEDKDYIYIVGPNGCGKSTILESIRAVKNSIPNVHNDLAFNSKESIKNNTEVEGLDQFDQICHLSATIDDGTNMFNACDAIAYIESGGWAQNNLSHGQRTQNMLGKFISKLDKLELTPGKCLFILDEVDKGFDLRFQTGFHFLIDNLIAKYKAKIITVTHNPICWMVRDKIYDFRSKKFMDPKLYIAIEIGYDFQFRRINFDNKK